MIRGSGQSEQQTIADLSHLADAIRAIECGASACASKRLDRQPEPLQTGWDDGREGGRAITRLARGCVHEWCGDAANREGGERLLWLPPLTLMVHLAWQAIETCTSAVAGARAVLWVGRACWPYAHTLVRGSSTARGRGPPAALDRRLLNASVFVDPPDDASRVWAIDLALRTGAVVIADGSRLDMTSSRRLQLAAEAGASLALLARPPWERKQLSAAATRWLVRPAASEGGGGGEGGVNPRWNVELIRCKGAQPHADGRREWTLEVDRARRVVCVLPSVVDRLVTPARAAG